MQEHSYHIVIVDDHQIFIDGVASLFNENDRVKIVGSANNSKQLFELLSTKTVDVILLDLNLGNEDGLNVLKQIRLSNKTVKVIALTMYNHNSLVKKIIKADGNGYVLKNTSKSNLNNAIQQVMDGKTFVDESLASPKEAKNEEVIFKEYPDDFMKKHNLSKREYEIIILLSESYSTKEIADLLTISEQTVSTYRKNIKAKMSFKTTTDIVRFVFENNLRELN